MNTNNETVKQSLERKLKITALANYIYQEKNSKFKRFCLLSGVVLLNLLLGGAVFLLIIMVKLLWQGRDCIACFWF